MPFLVLHHRMTFAAIQNLAVYLLGARVRTFRTLVSLTIVVFIVSYSMCLFCCDFVHIKGCEISGTIYLGQK